VREDPTLLDPVDQAVYLAAGICPAGQLVRVDDRYDNLDTRTVKGYDVGIYYNLDTRIGNFDFRYVASFLDEYTQTPGGAASLLLEAKNAGVIPPNIPVTGFASLVRQNGNAEDKHTLRASWNRGPFGAALSGVRLGDFVQTSLTLGDGTEYVIPTMSTFNASFDYGFDIGSNTDARVRLGINNFTDERAPLADDSFGYFADMHRDLGMSYYIDFRVDFL